MPNLNYAAQYGRELANAYPYLSYYADLWNQGESQRFRPLRVCPEIHHGPDHRLQPGGIRFREA